jgi:hypothetical protein
MTRISIENPLWGAPRIHGELLKLGFEVAQSSVAKYMVKRRGPPSQEWRTFLCNHAPDIAAMDLFVAPTIGFDRDRIYSTVVTRRLRAMGIRDKPTAPASPWQNGFAERLIGSIRRSVWTISSSWAKRICAEYCEIMLVTTTASERTGR